MTCKPIWALGIQLPRRPPRRLKEHRGPPDACTLRPAFRDGLPLQGESGDPIAARRRAAALPREGLPRLLDRAREGTGGAPPAAPGLLASSARGRGSGAGTLLLGRRGARGPGTARQPRRVRAATSSPLPPACPPGIGTAPPRPRRSPPPQHRKPGVLASRARPWEGRRGRGERTKDSRDGGRRRSRPRRAAPGERGRGAGGRASPGPALRKLSCAAPAAHPRPSFLPSPRAEPLRAPGSGWRLRAPRGCAPAGLAAQDRGSGRARRARAFGPS